MTIDPRDAASTLSDIDDITRRVRQSRIYQFASQTMILWGSLVFIGYAASYQWPRQAGTVWIAVYVAGIAGSFALSAVNRRESGVSTFDRRMFAAFVIFILFGAFCCGLGHFTPRQLGTFWPIYFMMAYGIVGLWVGRAFVAIAFGVTMLTLIGYFLTGDLFGLWMAVVNGGGLVFGGLWMRRS